MLNQLCDTLAMSVLESSTVVINQIRDVSVIVDTSIPVCKEMWQGRFLMKWNNPTKCWDFKIYLVLLFLTILLNTSYNICDIHACINSFITWVHILSHFVFIELINYAVHVDLVCSYSPSKPLPKTETDWIRTFNRTVGYTIVKELYQYQFFAYMIIFICCQWFLYRFMWLGIRGLYVD